jgi:hypothetical protein
MASSTTNKCRQLLALGLLDLDTVVLKAMLVTGSYTPDKDHDFVTSITGGTSKELSGTGYTAGFGGAGRKTLTTPTVVKDDSADKVYLDADDLTWPAINAGTVAYIAIIQEVTSDADSPLLAIVDISPDVTTNGGDYDVTWPADGVLNLT